MSQPVNHWSINVLSLVVALCLMPPVASATPPNYAMKMDKAATSLLLDIATAGDHLVAVGERGHILFSNSAGGSWTQAKVPTTTMLTRVFFISPDEGWAVGHDGNVLASHDGGVNWELQRNGVVDQARINEARAGRAKQRVAQLKAQLTNPATQTAITHELESAREQLDRALADLDDPVFPPPLMDVWFLDEHQGWASGGYGTLLHTVNGGRLWEDWSDRVDNPEQLHLNGVRGNLDGSVLLASEWGTIFRSATNGESWETIDTGYEGSFFGLLVNPLTHSVIAYGLRGTLYRSRDYGLEWTATESGINESLFGACAAPDGKLTFVGAGGTVIQSVDDGEHFHSLVQLTRKGIYGVAQLPNGSYVVTGEGGSRALTGDKHADAGLVGTGLEVAQ